VCKLRCRRAADTDAWLVLALRPQNPEGISFIHQVSLSPARDAWTSTTPSGSNSAPPPSGIMSPITATATCSFICAIATTRPKASATWAWSPRRRCFRSRPAKRPRSPRASRSRHRGRSPPTPGRRAARSLQLDLPGAALPVSLRRRAHLADPAFAGRRLSRPLHLQALLVPRCRLHHPCPAVRRPDRSRRTRAGALSRRGRRRSAISARRRASGMPTARCCGSCSASSP
jgi:hypothetical protein